jgi:hypothetical protein
MEMSTSRPSLKTTSCSYLEIEYKRGGRSSEELLQYLQELIQGFYSENPDATNVSFEIEDTHLCVSWQRPMNKEELQRYERDRVIRDLAEEKGITFFEATSYLKLKEKGVI